MIVSPHQFVGNFTAAGVAVDYVATRELGQGGPVIGYLRLAGRWVLYEAGQRAEFGGPLLVQGASLLAPLLRGFDFELARIDLPTCRIVATSAGREKLILPASAEGNTVFYYNDLENSQLKQCTLS